ncbi:DUF4097 family beta strand repeat-containing protein [Oceanobacillus bengalensis]|uniref:DUF4097 domain-containing protein n=1 Tax=Oceanobacillus bengalensis TaxID=1435466 RepID=A0A494YZW1_9BACI|nr:DUF4097 family beta strand repeat-containing protein [Oceanobacillus bengalensis]RKQ15543.1 hypothetical protein D8M05_09745 [Oceanobacillus bengalensis]
MKKNVIIVMVALIVVAAFIVNFFPFGNEKTKEIEIDDEAFTGVEIETENTKIEILPTDADFAKAVLSGDKSNKYKLDANVKGDTLQIVLDDRWFQFISFDFTFSTPLLTVYLPEKEYEIVQVETDNGTIQADQLEAKEVSAESNNGKIELKNIKSEWLDINVDNGQVLLENVEGEINGKSDNGKITLITESLDRDIALKTDNGEINIQTEKEPTNATIDIKVDNGRVSVFGDSLYDTIIGDGEHVIELKADNGYIEIK